MDTLQKSFDEMLQKLAESAESAEELEKLTNTVSGRFEEYIANLPNEILDSIKGKAEEGLRERRLQHAEFVERNIQRWNEPFDLLELHIEVATEAGESFNKRLRPEALSNGDLLFDLLVRLHAKGCLTSKEICCLIKNGYAEGAHARWRALHEISVTAIFLSKHGDEAAKRFLDHEFVDAYKGASQLSNYQSRLNTTGFSHHELIEFKKNYEATLKKYGKEFSRPYGWAKPFLVGENLTFSALEKAVELDHWRPYYKWASQNTHANAKTIKNSLGLSEFDHDGVLVGPSDSGMTDPAHSTTISLTQITCALLFLSPNIDDLVMAKLLSLLSDKVGDSFLHNDKKAST